MPGVVAAALPLFGTMAARRTAWAWVAVALLASAELPPAVRRAQLRGSSNASGVRRLQSYYDLRLIGGSSEYEGRVEIYYGGQWGTVCDDYWDISDANVVCRQLFGTDALEAKTSAFFGQGSGTVWGEGFSCAGDEAALSDCSKRYNTWARTTAVTTRTRASFAPPHLRPVIIHLLPVAPVNVLQFVTERPQIAMMSRAASSVRVTENAGRRRLRTIA